MKKKLVSLALALAMCLSLMVPATAWGGGNNYGRDEDCETVSTIPCDIQWGNYTAETAASFEKQVYNAMIAVKSIYPDGTSWTNDNKCYYPCYDNDLVGYGCAAFAMLLSDAAFGSLPDRKLDFFIFNDIRVGDILRINNDTHSVVVLEKHDDYVIIAEGNYNYAVKWGRKLSKATVEAATYVCTRYPEIETASASADSTSFSDVTAASPYQSAIEWAVKEKIAAGYSDGTFRPNNTCTISHIWTFLYRAIGTPITADTEEASARIWASMRGLNADDESQPCTRALAVTYIWKAAGNPAPVSTASFSDVSASSEYAQAVSWAVEKGITTGTSASTFSPDATCTRGQIVTFLYRASQ